MLVREKSYFPLKELQIFRIKQSDNQKSAQRDEQCTVWIPWRAGGKEGQIKHRAHLLKRTFLARDDFGLIFLIK